MQHRDKITIWKIIEEIDIGVELLGKVSPEQFLENEMLKRAMGMTCINVGELVKVISDDLRNEYKTFPWKAVAGMRDITAHRYQTLRMEDVYLTIHDEYPWWEISCKLFLNGNKTENKTPIQSFSMNCINTKPLF